MSRSLRVRQDCIPKVKSAVQRNGYPRQKDLAEDVGCSLATASNFLNGKPVDFTNFIEICDRLGLDWKDIAASDSNGSNSTTVAENAQPEEVSALAFPDELEAEDFIYVERPPIESLCYQTLCQPGSLLRIKAPGLMGKTSLMAKVLPQLARQGYRTVSLNLHYAETEDFTNLDKFLKWFCVSVGQSLRMPNQLADYWDERFSTSKMNCTAYFEEYLLAKADSPLILCLDEVERIFSYREVASDFLGLLRAWHEQAKIRNIWKRLRLVVIHSTEVYVPLKLNESPFNVGLPIELPEFTPEQVQNLAQQQGLSWDFAQVKQLMEMVGGHPELVQQALSYLKITQSVTLEQVLQDAATEAGIYGNYLRRYWGVVQQHSELAEALKKVVKATTSVRLEPMQAYKLHRMGLVHLAGNEVTIGCNLYRQYFCDRLLGGTVREASL
jgi:DNA-binding Xre family transcriptional regulator